MKAFVERMKPRLEEYDGLLTYNPIFMDRTIGIGRLPAATALDLGVTGPMLRGKAAFRWTSAKTTPTAATPISNSNVPVGKNGDCYDRFMVRRTEMAESLKIVESRPAINFPTGPPWAKSPKFFVRAPAKCTRSMKGRAAGSVITSCPMEPTGRTACTSARLRLSTCKL